MVINLKKTNLKIISYILTFIAIISLFTACEKDDGSGYTFKANLASNPQNLDPQLAVDTSSKTVLSNMLDGLVKINKNGSIEADAAEKYTISDDGLVYTFELKRGIYWESLNDYKAEMTADDFVFAFQRIFDSNALYSPYVNDFSCIKNSADVAQGAKSIDQLGVKATDTYTLQIELEYPYYDFLELLTTTAAMPCNRYFFESTKGRYGLSAETSASNGAFYLKEWNYDAYWDNNYIIMRRNKSNSATDFVYPYSLNFFITGNSQQDADDYTSGNIDCYKTEIYNKKILNNNNFEQYSTKSFGLIFNTKSAYFSNSNLRFALASAFSREAYSSLIDENYQNAYGIVPSSVTILGKGYRDLISETALSLYDANTAAQLWRSELSKINAESIDGIKITVPEDFGGSDYLYYITEQWQQNLGFFCGVEVVSENEYNMKIDDGTFEIALVEIAPAENSPNDFLEYFSNGESKILMGYKNMSVYGNMQNVRKAGSLSNAIEYYSAAEKDIINSAVYIPLFYGNEYFIYGSDMADLIYYPFTNEVDFRYAKSF